MKIVEFIHKWNRYNPGERAAYADNDPTLLKITGCGQNPHFKVAVLVPEENWTKQQRGPEVNKMVSVADEAKGEDTMGERRGPGRPRSNN